MPLLFVNNDSYIGHDTEVRQTNEFCNIERQDRKKVTYCFWNNAYT